MNHLSMLRRAICVAFLLSTLTLVATDPALAQPAPHDAHFASLRMGDTEAAVIQVMQNQPKEIRRDSLLGVERSVLVFEFGRARHQITFVGGRLVSKSVETKPTTWGLF